MKKLTLPLVLVLGTRASRRFERALPATALASYPGSGNTATRLLIDAGCPPTGGAADEMGRVAIHRAAARGAAKCCEALLRAGAAVDARHIVGARNPVVKCSVVRVARVGMRLEVDMQVHQ